MAQALKRAPRRTLQRRLEAPIRHGEARLDLATADLDARTIEAEFTAGERVLRDDLIPGERVWEELSLEPGALVLDLLNSGAPVTDSHYRERARRGVPELEMVIGVVVRAWIPPAGLPRVLMRISDRDERVDSLWRDIAGGILRQVSPGYLYHELVDVTPQPTPSWDGYRVLRATRWEPYEIAFTPAAFDRRARTRSQSSGGHHHGLKDLRQAFDLVRSLAAAPTCTIYDSEARRMDEELENGADSGASGPTAANGGAAQGGAQAPAQGASSATTAAGAARATTATSPPAAGAAAATSPAARAATQDPPPATPAAAQPHAGSRSAPASSDAQASLAVATAAERSRVLGLQELGQRFQLPAEQVRTWIDGSTPIESARAAAVELVLARSMESTGRLTAHSQVVTPEADKVWRAIDNALDVRGGIRSRGADGRLGARVAPADGARALVGRSIVELAERCLRLRGVNTDHLVADEILEVAMQRSYRGVDLVGGAERSFGGGIGTTDFAALLSNLANKSLRQAYDEMMRTFEPLARNVDARDFKPLTRIQLGNAPDLELVPESGEVGRGSLPDSAETYALSTYSKILAFTRQAMLNDDLGALTGLASRFGAAASRKESDLAWGLVTGNVVMGDGVQLFNAAHRNVGTGALGVGTAGTGLDLWLEKLRMQLGLQGEHIRLNMGYLVVPPALETKALQFVAALTPQTATGVNPLIRQIKGVISEPRLQDTSSVQWYGTCDPMDCPVFERAYLRGTSGPQLSSREGFQVLGMEFRAVHDVALAIVEFIAWYRSTGS